MKDQLIEGTHDLSGEMPTALEAVVFKGADGKIIVKESVEKFPQEKWTQEKKSG